MEARVECKVPWKAEKFLLGIRPGLPLLLMFALMDGGFVVSRQLHERLSTCAKKANFSQISAKRIGSTYWMH
jgi:hypothetical protein